MDLLVLSGKVVHKNKIYDTDDVIYGVEEQAAERLCRQGYCSILESDRKNSDKDVINYEEMTKAELLELAGAQGKTLNKKLTKEKIIELITE